MFVIAAALIVVVNGALIVAVVRFRERRGARGRAGLTPGAARCARPRDPLGILALAIFVFGSDRTDDVRTVEPSGPNGLGRSPTTQVGVHGVSRQASPTRRTLRNRSLQCRRDPPTEGRTRSRSTPSPSSGSGASSIRAASRPSRALPYSPTGGRPGQRTFSYSQLVVPVDTTVILNITSTDVLHSWSVPRSAGRSRRRRVRWPRRGSRPIRSAPTAAVDVFSGTSFPAMRSWVKVVSVPEYEAYVKQLAEDLVGAQDFVQTQRTATHRRMTP